MKGQTRARLYVAVLVISLFFTASGRGYWAVAQCLHAALPPVIQLHSNHHGYDIHHHSIELSHTVNDITHHIVHIMDSIEYSMPVVTPFQEAPKPDYAWVVDDPPLPADVIPAQLYRPPKRSHT